MKPVLIVLGNQLFPLEHLPAPEDVRIYMAEDFGLCTYVRHHQQKIVLFLAAMRSYADALRSAGYDVSYQRLAADETRSYEARLGDELEASGTSELLHFEIEDKAMESRLIEFARSCDLTRNELQSPMFLCSRADFETFAADSKRLVMGEFYKQQRRTLDILVDAEGQPVGGQWSFDADNRRKLPKTVEPPQFEWASQDRTR